MPQRYFLEQINNRIEGQDAHHIKKVMRMKDSDEIIVCSGGKCYLASIQIGDDSVSYDLIHELKRGHQSDITLIQGLPKGAKNEFVVKYSTIFDVSKIIFVPMKRSIAKLENTENKIKRLSLIAKEAAELAHRFDIPQLMFEKSLKNIDYSSYDLILLADENNKTKTIDQVIINPISNQKILLIIGPEGGIDESERSMLLAKKAVSISLGQNIIPTEAACLYALSYLSVKKT
ncbi:MAG: 16S rRNA (uracil(1498)-N(3))-methyltransferase [Acholeplasmataceae bacterium]|nr:16S rRNA (uracil(1498)-N(3))-methyltransferase [Acholeplasmataceae bacterium]